MHIFLSRSATPIMCIKLLRHNIDIRNDVGKDKGKVMRINYVKQYIFKTA